jgi:serine/threonine protein kinase
MSAEVHAAHRIVGRYALYDEIAAGGMATVHIGRLMSDVGFSRTVAIKRLHPQFAKDRDFVTMFIDEARLAARIRHANVVSTLDVEEIDGELFLVMEYVPGESLARLFREARQRREAVPPAILVAVVAGALVGLHAAHEAHSESGEPLAIVHRDVSPHNILVGTDGVSRVLDFGIAKASHRLQQTRSGEIKGKAAYMSPEQLINGEVDRRADIYAMGAVAWEGLTGRKLFDGPVEAQFARLGPDFVIDRPSAIAPHAPPAFDDVVMRALAKAPSARYETAAAFADALERAQSPASARQMGEWVNRLAGEGLRSRAERIDTIERTGAGTGSSREAVLAAVESSSTGLRASAVSGVGDGDRSDLSRAKMSLSLSNPPAAPSRSRAGRAGIVIAGLGIVLFSFGAVHVLHRRAAAEARDVAPAEPPPMASSAPPPATIAEPDASATESARAAPSATDATTTHPSPHPTTRPIARPPTSPESAKGAAARTAPLGNVPSDLCKSPYFIEDGIKKIRRECVP